MERRTALIIGATGMVGRECLKELLDSPVYKRVTALVRKPLDIKHPKLEVLVADFTRLKDYKQDVRGHDVYCAIGTTIGKAGSKEAFKKVDYEYPLKVAELTLWNGAKKFILVSSLGANAGSKVFYSKVKGELEEALKKLNFESLVIFRPSILLGNREESRPGEAIGMFVSKKLPFLFVGPLKAYRGTPADLLAKRMVQAGLEKTTGLRIIENNEILDGAE